MVPHVRLVTAEENLGPRQKPLSGALAPAHTVQFYENEHFLSAAVADFLAAGITVGQKQVGGG